jgi:hypothetical protein
MIHGKQIDGTPTKLAIITVYCPLTNRSGGAWTMLQNCLTANNNKRDPAQQFYHELTESVCAAHKEGANVIMGGDFNTPFDVAHRYSKELENLMRIGGLEHVLSRKHPTEEFTTYVHSENLPTGRTCPDGVYASIGLTNRAITRIGVPQEQYMHSRHRPIVIEVNLIHLLGSGLTQLAPNTNHLLQPMLPRLLDPGNLPLLLKYEDSLERQRKNRQLMERVEALNMGTEIGWRGTPPVVVKESSRTNLTLNIQKECDTLQIEIETAFVEFELEHQKKI